MKSDICRNRFSGGRASGFTLIELMITVAVVGILAAIAYASYREYVIRTRRTAGGTCLLERAQFLERFYTTRLTYENVYDGGDPPPCDPDIAPFYTVGWVPGNEPAAKTYTLQAVPQGTQQEDTACGTLTLNAQGERGRSGTAADITDCW